MMSAHYPTDKGVAARVEELLREQLLELGEDPASLAPHLIMQNMQCEVYPDESMVYIWKDIPDPPRRPRAHRYGRHVAHVHPRRG